MARSYVVAVHGNDDNPGTQERPWRTIQNAADRLQPGDTVHVRGGVYEESVVIRKSGAPGEQITFRNYPGERPVIDPAFRAGVGIRVSAGYIGIEGFEIRNCRSQLDRREDTAGVVIVDSHHCVAQRNTVHHIIGVQRADAMGEPSEGKTSTGIHVQDSDHITVQSNTVYDIVGHSECKGIVADTVSNTAIRKNLVYLCDKEGIRLLSFDAEGDNVVEGNIVLSNNIGIAVNNCRPESHANTIRSNFSGWNCTVGIQVKHTTHTVLTHNTVYANHGLGLKLNDRPFNYYAVVKNNLLSDNMTTWEIIDSENFHETVDYDFYQYQPGGRLAYWNATDAGTCGSLLDIRRKTAESDSVGVSYELHGREGDPLFVCAEGRDFGLQAASAARGAADDGKEMGALESELIEVGADVVYGLSNIPDLGELTLQVESFSSETERGRAANAVERSSNTYWEVDATKDSARAIVLRLPGEKAHEITFITLTKPDPRSRYYREFGLYADDGSGAWNAVAESPQHPFAGYTSQQGINNGETWALPAGTMARRLRIELVSGYSEIIRLPEIRVYARPCAPGSP